MIFNLNAKKYEDILLVVLHVMLIFLVFTWYNYRYYNVM